MSMSTWTWTEPVAGAAAGVLQDAVMHPMDTLRARLDMGTGLVSPALRLPSPHPPSDPHAPKKKAKQSKASGPRACSVVSSAQVFLSFSKRHTACAFAGVLLPCVGQLLPCKARTPATAPWSRSLHRPAPSITFTHAGWATAV
jgi:hypothetical protein